MKKTKIVATLGPASLKREVLKNMMLEGLNVCRLNFSHGSYDDHAGAVELIRSLNEELGLNVAILADLQGPKIRTNEMENNGVPLVNGEEILLVVDKVVGNKERFSINYTLLPKEVKAGERILLDDGKIVLEVRETDGHSTIRCEIIQGGILSSKKGVNFPNTKISMPSLTEKDIADLEFALNHQVDWIGIVLLSAFIGSLQYVLEHGQQDDWFNDEWIVRLSVLSVVGLFFFIWRQLSYAYPIVNLKVLKDSNLRVGVVMSFIMGFGLYGSTFIIPIYTQSILGWTATDAGLLLVPSSITVAIMMPFIGKLIQRGVPQTYLVAMGFLSFFIFTYWMHNIMTPDTGEEHMFWPLIVRGLGLGLLFVPITTLSLSGLKGKSIGEGAAFTGMMRQLGGSFGIAIITTFLARFGQEHRVNLIGYLDPTRVAVQEKIHGLQNAFIAKGYSAEIALQKAFKVMELSVTKQSTVLSYMDVFLYLGVLFLFCIPFILLIKKGKNKVNPSEAMH